MLLATTDGLKTIRVYDGANGYNEMHRYTRDGGKSTGVVFHSGTLGDGYNAAVENIERGHLRMIEGWEGR